MYRARRNRNAGFTLLEVMLASVVMAIILMGLISSMTGAFLATNVANKTSASQALARQMIEQATDLDANAMVLLNSNALVTADGLAARYQVYQVSTGLYMLEVEVCRPSTAQTAAQISAMTMPAFHALNCADGSRVRFSVLTVGAVGRVNMTNQTGTAGTGSGSNWWD